MNKRKENYLDSIAEYKKSAVTNLMALVSFYAIDLIVIMVQVNQYHTNSQNTELHTMVLYWSMITYLALFAMTFLSYRGIKNDRFDQVRLILLCMLIVTIANMATFIFAGFVYSIILVVPILMLVYIREKTKRINQKRI